MQFENNYLGIKLFRNNKYYLAVECIELVLQLNINALFSVPSSSQIVGPIYAANLYVYNAGSMVKLM